MALTSPSPVSQHCPPVLTPPLLCLLDILGLGAPPSWDLCVFHCLCLEASSSRSLLSELTSLRPYHPQGRSLSPSHLYSGSPFLSLAPQFCFLFLHSSTTLHMFITICCPSWEWGVHEGGVLALLTEGTLCLEDCVVGSRCFTCIY